jgi:hypothetical protein
MKIRVESIGLPTLADVIGKQAEIEFPGGTVAELIVLIAGRFGPRARRVLLDRCGNLDVTVQVMINEEGFLRGEELAARRLADGDRVRFMLLVGGG